MRARLLPTVLLTWIATPALAITVNLTAFEFPTPSTLTTQGNAVYSGWSGAFRGQLGGDSFVAYCAELTQVVYFGTTYDYTLTTPAAYFTGSKGSDLSRLFTAAQGFVVDAASSAAMQAGIWEIIYQSGDAYDLTRGDFQIVAQNPSDSATVAALNTVNGYLLQLDTYAAARPIGVLANTGSQDLIYLSPAVPEPQAWVLLAGGLACLGLARPARRRGGARRR